MGKRIYFRKIFRSAQTFVFRAFNYCFRSKVLLVSFCLLIGFFSGLIFLMYTQNFSEREEVAYVRLPRMSLEAAPPKRVGAEEPLGAVPSFKQRVITAIMRDIEEQWKNAPVGMGTLKLVDTMEVGASHPYPMVLVVSLDKTLKELHDNLQRQFPEATGSFFDGISIELAPRLSANVAPNNAFDVTPVTPSETILVHKKASWKWNVIPKKQGNHRIEVIVNGRIAENGEYRTLKTFASHVNVSVGSWYKVKESLVSNAKYLIGTLLLPGFLYLCKRIREYFRRRRKLRIELLNLHSDH